MGAVGRQSTYLEMGAGVIGGDQSRYGILGLKPLHITFLMCQVGMLTEFAPWMVLRFQ